MTEERITSSSGGQKGKKPEAFGGGDPLAYTELAKVYAMGEAKYDRFNYLKGYAWSLSIDALFRHLFAFLAGEERDPESGLLHTSHVAWHAQALTSFQLRGLRKFDDRAPRVSPQDAVPHSAWWVVGVDLANGEDETVTVALRPVDDGRPHP